MHALLNKIDAIELKARQLVQKIDGLEREKDFLLQENIRLKKDLNQYIDKIEGLHKAVESKKNSSLLNKEVFKQRIKHLEVEVEECIKLLNT